MTARRWLPFFGTFALGGATSIVLLIAGVYLLSLIIVDVPYIHYESTVLESQQYGTQKAGDFSRVLESALPEGATVEIVAEGLEQPVAIALLPDGGALITERGGRVRLLRSGVLEPAPVLSLTDTGAEKSLELGLLGIAVRPRSSDQVYVYHTVEKGGAVVAAAIERYRWDGRRLRDGRTVHEIALPKGVEAHVGGSLAFGPDGMLYVTVGDTAGLSAKSIRAQDLSNPYGAVLRIAPDGAVPDDNPFAKSAAADGRVFAYGLRNAFGLTFDRDGGDLWAVEAGSADSDEVNRIVPGANYGWPIVIGWAHQMPYQLPVAVFESATTPTGPALYRGAMFPEWQGDLLFCSFNDPVLHRIAADDLASETPADVERLPEAAGCVTAVAVAGDGSVYLLDFFEGKLLRLAR
jgi:glucose/arabinose dehydrogenase